MSGVRMHCKQAAHHELLIGAQRRRPAQPQREACQNIRGVTPNEEAKGREEVRACSRTLRGGHA